MINEIFDGVFDFVEDAYEFITNPFTGITALLVILITALVISFRCML